MNVESRFLLSLNLIPLKIKLSFWGFRYFQRFYMLFKNNFFERYNLHTIINIFKVYNLVSFQKYTCQTSKHIHQHPKFSCTLHYPFPHQQNKWSAFYYHRPVFRIDIHGIIIICILCLASFTHNYFEIHLSYFMYQQLVLFYCLIVHCWICHNMFIHSPM